MRVDQVLRALSVVAFLCATSGLASAFHAVAKNDATTVMVASSPLAYAASRALVDDDGLDDEGDDSDDAALAEAHADAPPLPSLVLPVNAASSAACSGYRTQLFRPPRSAG